MAEFLINIVSGGLTSSEVNIEQTDSPEIQPSHAEIPAASNQFGAEIERSD